MVHLAWSRKHGTRVREPAQRYNRGDAPGIVDIIDPYNVG